MYRLAASLLAVLLLVSCSANPFANLQQNITHLAQEQIHARLATQLVASLGTGIRTLVDGLAKPGGYLDNPLVRILLPPPLTVALDLARDIAYKPESNPLVVLMNRAAETAVPGAGPILEAALNQLTVDEAKELLKAGGTAATERLKEKTAGQLRERLAPAVLDSLTKDNGLQQYTELLDAFRAQKAVSRPVGEPTFDEPVADLGEYVTQQAVEGIFKAMGAEELRIRETIDMPSDELQSIIHPRS
ncbi:DUF4197 domain-containing protein [Trichloromonas sp.]|uniref:DUF4197 domain-containing protein n=1 Tax=Trichloromonas sp. TaxID=3069249 RepID=UPI003D817F23